MLLASRSVWSTMEIVVLLRRCTMVGPLLLLLWSLSPLGGQASQRALERREKVSHRTSRMRYLYTGPYAQMLGANETRRNLATDTFASVLCASPDMKASPRDSWGNVRIPRLEKLLDGAASSSAANTGSRTAWLHVPLVQSAEQYSSLLGILPAAAANTTAEFTLETTYMSLWCWPWTTFPDSDGQLAHYRQLRKTGNIFHVKAGLNTTFFLDGDMPIPKSFDDIAAARRDQKPRHLFFVSRTGVSRDQVGATTCTVTENHVEVAVTCSEGRTCRAARIRRSLGDTHPASATPLDSLPALTYMNLVSRLFNTQESTSTPVEHFLRDGPEKSPTTSRQAYVTMSDVQPSRFSDRLTLVVNAWWQVGLLPLGTVLLGDNPATNLSIYGHDFAQLATSDVAKQRAIVLNERCGRMCSRSTEASVAQSVQVFAYNPTWLALLFCSATVLLAVGLTGAYLERRVMVPDMLGYVTSMTYNNDYVALPDENSGEGYSGRFDAMEMARILCALPVSIRDVNGDDDVGRVAFTTVEGLRKLEKGRSYV